MLHRPRRFDHALSTPAAVAWILCQSSPTDVSGILLRPVLAMRAAATVVGQRVLSPFAAGPDVLLEILVIHGSPSGAPPLQLRDEEAV